METNPIAEAWRIATSPDEMGLAYASPFYFIDNRGLERRCTALIPHIGSPMGTLISTRYDPDPEGFIAAVRGLGYYAVTLHNDRFARYDREQFVRAIKDWGWYGPDALLPTFFDEGAQEGAPG